jgi:hypothetical protein
VEVEPVQGEGEEEHDEQDKDGKHHGEIRVIAADAEKPGETYHRDEGAEWDGAACEGAKKAIMGVHAGSPYWRLREKGWLLPWELVRVRPTAESEEMDWVKFSFWT